MNKGQSSLDYQGNRKSFEKLENVEDIQNV